MKIVKLGGSLSHDDRLRSCIEHIAAQERGSQPVIIVPGGGGFADQVRLAQQQWHFNDVVAHHMAILAMQQMALLINAMQPNWRLIKNLAELNISSAGVIIWWPEIELLNAYALPASWAITSDSLAVWLGTRLAVGEIIIVKAAKIPMGASLIDLVADGILDAAFMRYANEFKNNITVVHSGDFLSRVWA